MSNHLIPSPYRDMLIAARMTRADINDIVAVTKKAHPDLFVTADEERERNWTPPSISRKEGNHAT